MNDPLFQPSLMPIYLLNTGPTEPKEQVPPEDRQDKKDAAAAQVILLSIIFL